MNRQTVNIGGQRVTLTNLQKPLWPDAGLTKGDYIHYLLQVAPVLLPHLRGRPLVLTRYPNGTEGKWFYQKNTPATAPEWLQTWTDTHGERPIRYVICNDLQTLAWLGNQAAIELHPWYSLAAAPQRPTVAVIDLDPSEGTDFDDARELAFIVRRFLQELGLNAYPKTSGATGLHLYIPIAPVHTYDEVVAFTRRLSELVEKTVPNRATTERTVKDRTGRVYLDFLQNGRGKTLASAYAPRPRAGAPVSAPLTWSELETAYPGDFTLRTVPERVQAVGDVFAPVLAGGQTLHAAGRALGVWT